MADYLSRVILAQEEIARRYRGRVAHVAVSHDDSCSIMIAGHGPCTCDPLVTIGDCEILPDGTLKELTDGKEN